MKASGVKLVALGIKKLQVKGRGSRHRTDGCHAGQVLVKLSFVAY